MNQKMELCFVQFMHPGKEHGADDDGRKQWNDDIHKRKFMEINGRYLDKGNRGEGPIRFWGEWEAQSEVEAIPDPVPYGPRFLHRPYYAIPPSYQGLQNTDPFVFGGFFYTGCQQYSNGQATQLRYLEKGSVILFGSNVEGQFAIDTVFVVATWQDHTVDDYASLSSLPKAYFDITLSPWYESHEGTCSSNDAAKHSRRLYFGATFENQIDGMFSFFPCLRVADCQNGFRRPALEIAQVITPKLLQGKRLNRQLGKEKVVALWKKVRDQVEGNCCLGIHAAMPQEHTSRER